MRSATSQSTCTTRLLIDSNADRRLKIVLMYVSHCLRFLFSKRPSHKSDLNPLSCFFTGGGTNPSEKHARTCVAPFPRCPHPPTLGSAQLQRCCPAPPASRIIIIGGAEGGLPAAGGRRARPYARRRGSIALRSVGLRRGWQPAVFPRQGQQPVGEWVRHAREQREVAATGALSQSA